MFAAEQIQVVERKALGLAIIQARRGISHERIGAALGLKLPAGPERVDDAGLTAIGTGPGSWFVIAENAANDWAERLAASLHQLAAVFDQSSGYTVLRLSGPNARTALQAGVPLDLHPSQFRAESAASTAIAHIPVLLWQADAEQSFDLAFYRSYRESLAALLRETVNTYGAPDAGIRF